MRIAGWPIGDKKKKTNKTCFTSCMYQQKSKNKKIKDNKKCKLIYMWFTQGPQGVYVDPQTSCCNLLKKVIGLLISKPINSGNILKFFFCL